MQNIEKYIKDHVDEFDSGEPDEGHFNRFAERLAARPLLKPASHRPSVMLLVAALIIVMISVSVFVFDFATSGIRKRITGETQGAELPLEIREAVQYYDNQTSRQIDTLAKLAENHSETGALCATALKDVRSLDATTAELKRSLTENPGDERVLDAIIRNQQMKEAMLNTIIARLARAQNQ